MDDEEGTLTPEQIESLVESGKVLQATQMSKNCYKYCNAQKGLSDFVTCKGIPLIQLNVLEYQCNTKKLLMFTLRISCPQMQKTRKAKKRTMNDLSHNLFRIFKFL